MKPGIMELTQDSTVIQNHIDKNLATYNIEYLNYPILLGHFFYRAYSQSSISIISVYIHIPASYPAFNRLCYD